MNKNISVDYINQGHHDYLGAEISINGQIICLLAIDDDLTLSLEFFHENYLDVHKTRYKVDYQEFLQVLKECKLELGKVIEKIKVTQL